MRQDRGRRSLEVPAEHVLLQSITAGFIAESGANPGSPVSAIWLRRLGVRYPPLSFAPATADRHLPAEGRDFRRADLSGVPEHQSRRSVAAPGDPVLASVDCGTGPADHPDRRRRVPLAADRPRLRDQPSAAPCRGLYLHRRAVQSDLALDNRRRRSANLALRAGCPTLERRGSIGHRGPYRRADVALRDRAGCLTLVAPTDRRPDRPRCPCPDWCRRLRRTRVSLYRCPFRQKPVRECPLAANDCRNGSRIACDRWCIHGSAGRRIFIVRPWDDNRGGLADRSGDRLAARTFASIPARAASCFDRGNPAVGRRLGHSRRGDARRFRLCRITGGRRARRIVAARCGNVCRRCARRDRLDGHRHAARAPGSGRVILAIPSDEAADALLD